MIKYIVYLNETDYIQKKGEIMLDLNQIQTFNKVFEKGSFSKAAEDLYLTQPTISFHIKSLEKILGVELFRRKFKSQNPATEAAEILYQYTYNILALLKEGEIALSEYREGTGGSLSLAVSPTVLNWFLYDTLRKFKNKYPNINLTIHSSFSPLTIQKVLNREVQFGIIRHSSDSYNNTLFDTEYIASDESIFICSSNHKLKNYKELFLKDIKDESFIVYAKNTNYWEQVKQNFEAHHFQPKISIELNDINTIKKMVGLGMGISCVPKLSVKQELLDEELIELNICDFPKINRYSFLIFRKDHIFTGASYNFYNLLINK